MKVSPNTKSQQAHDADERQLLNSRKVSMTTKHFQEQQKAAQTRRIQIIAEQIAKEAEGAKLEHRRRQKFEENDRTKGKSLDRPSDDKCCDHQLHMEEEPRTIEGENQVKKAADALHEEAH